ncbi:hypothetical protein MTO96_013941 [Rhipicephalus appendiculatus]
MRQRSAEKAQKTGHAGMRRPFLHPAECIAVERQRVRQLCQLVATGAAAGGAGSEPLPASQMQVSSSDGHKAATSTRTLPLDPPRTAVNVNEKERRVAVPPMIGSAM